MKIRTGFVSNSSSASFVIHWRPKTMGEKVSLKEALSNIYGVTSYKIETDEVNWQDNWDKECQPKFEKTKEQTKDNGDGTYTTHFCTSMMNTADDFGEVAKSFVFNMMLNDNFHIIDTKLESDGM